MSSHRKDRPNTEANTDDGYQPRKPTRVNWSRYKNQRSDQSKLGEHQQTKDPHFSRAVIVTFRSRFVHGFDFVLRIVTCFGPRPSKFLDTA